MLHTVVDVCYRLLDWEEIDETFFLKVGGHGPCGGLQQPQYMLERQHSTAAVIPEVSGVQKVTSL